MKQLLRLLLVIMLSMATNEAFAIDVEIDGIYYYLSSDYSNNYHASVTYKDEGKETPSYSGNIVIPETIRYEDNVYEVNKIGTNAFAGCTNLISVIIPNTVHHIFSRAFAGCTGLLYVYIPENARIWEDAFKGCVNLFKNSTKATLNITKTVIDTLKAEKKFEEIKPILLKQYQEEVMKQQRCSKLSEMKGKKVKEDADIAMLSIAYEYYLKKYPNERKYKKLNYFSKYPFEREEVYDNNVKKGKITENVARYLSCYNRYLIDSLQQEKEKIDKGWSECIESDKLPYKEITVSMPNSLYRGYRYLNQDFLDDLDVSHQKMEWEFLDTGKSEYRSESYPKEVGYWVYDAAPNYRVICHENGIKEVYDERGQLVYVSELTREKNKSELKDPCRLVYLKDYTNNKYDIKSQPKETQEYIKLRLCSANGYEDAVNEARAAILGSAIAGAFATILSPVDAYKVRNKAKEQVLAKIPRRDQIGERYIEQLEKDHADEFEYVYTIERLTNVRFQVVYLNKLTLKPSHCALITYKTGDKPYTKTFSTKLRDMPSDIPPVIRNNAK